MKTLLRWVLLYKTKPGAIFSVVIGAICLILGGYLVLLGVVFDAPRDWALGRIESMILYAILGVVLLGGGVVSLVEIDTRQRTQRQWVAARAAEWAALPIGDPRRKNPPGHWEV